jgi:hypothetical protein
LRLLRKWDYDLKGRMGSLLRGKWDFTRRDRAREAYLKVFGKDFSEKLNSIFNNNNLRWTAALRNAIVHKAGVADHEFIRLVSDHSTLGVFREGETILLDGAMVSELVNGTVRSGVGLIEFVDGWLVEHKE